MFDVLYLTCQLGLKLSNNYPKTYFMVYNENDLQLPAFDV